MDDRKYGRLSDEEFIRRMYWDLLGREADDDGIRHYLRQLREGRQSRSRVKNYLKACIEYSALSGDHLAKKVFENVNLNDTEIKAGKAVLESTPYYFNLDLIGVCNIHPPCVMCLDWDGPKGPRHHPGMTVQDVEQFGEFIYLAHEIINCSIGEPLLTKDLIPILKLFKSWKKPFGINSNGLGLTPKMTDSLVPYFEILTIMFSVDGTTQKTYSKIRGEGFEKVISNIAYYCNKRKQEYREGLPSRAGMVMIPMRENRHEVPDFIRLAARLGVDEVELRSLNEIGNEVIVERKGFVFNYKEQILSVDELEAVYQEARKVAKQEGILLNCQYQATDDETFDFLLPEKYRNLNIKCVQPWRFFLPYQNGETIGCCYMNRSLGNWRKSGLEALWNSPRMQKIRSQMASGKLPDECRGYSSCPVVKSVFATVRGKSRNNDHEKIGNINISNLSSGWWDLESNGGNMWIWSKGISKIKIPEDAKNAELEISSDYFSYSNEPIFVEIFDEEGRILMSQSLKGEKKRISVNVSSVDHLMLKTSRTWKPSDLISESTDNRELGIRLDLLRFS